MSALGTYQWTVETNGKLRWNDRLKMVANGVRARLETKQRLNAGVKFRYIEVEDILPPDTAIAREALSLCQGISEPYLLNHCLRSYFWARLLDDGSRPFDDEALFASMMLHDMGWTDKHRLIGNTEQCFTIVGAKMALALASKHGWGEQRAEVMANAITLHLNITVNEKHGREAQLVRAGTGGDVAWLGMDVLHQDQIDKVVQKYPRENFKEEATQTLEIEARERPCCRVAFMFSRLGFKDLIGNAPFTE
ncbi:MAG: hypothetical protein KUG59_03275 [Parvibaculaceae bacterium]|nr:hypothetical protein [Parvibaculaceae bacterium]